jgi:hypothetical protein
LAAAAGLSGLAARLAEAGRRRFVSWDDAVWESLCAGPAAALEGGLRRRAFPPAAAAALLESYLELGAEAVGNGYLHDAGSGPAGFLAHAWRDGLPAALPALAPDRAAQLVADCWNLGENLESAPVWTRRIFTRALAERREQGLQDLRGLVEEVSREAFGEPRATLGERVRRHWVHLAEEDHRFLPGRIQFLAPAVVAVHDRQQQDAAGASPAMGVWLTSPPVFLGSLGRLEPPTADPGLRMDLLEELARADPTAADWHSMAANRWRAAVSLELSQYLVALLPA